MWGLLALVLLLGIGARVKFGPLLKGAKSVEKLDDGLYYLEFRGDDGFAALIEKGGGRSAGELSGYVMEFLSGGFYHPGAGESVPADYGCSALTARTPEGGVLMGTAWTLVMDLTNPAVTYYSRRHFDKPLRFEFERKGAE